MLQLNCWLYIRGDWLNFIHFLEMPIENMSGTKTSGTKHGEKAGFFNSLFSSASRTRLFCATVLMGSEAQCPEALCGSKVFRNKMGCCSHVSQSLFLFMAISSVMKGSSASCNRSNIEMRLFYYCSVQKHTKRRHVRNE